MKEMEPIPRPQCVNRLRKHIKCQRMCCKPKKAKPKPSNSTQMVFDVMGKHRKPFEQWE